MEEVQVVDVKAQAVLGMRKKGSYKEIPVLLKEICDFAVQKKAEMSGAPVFVCHEMTVEEVCAKDKAGTADVEVCFPVAKKMRGTKDIKCYELPGGKMAKAIHKGPYADCGPAYQKLLSWLEKNNKKPAGPFREVYLNDPAAVPESELLTEIYAPIN